MKEPLKIFEEVLSHGEKIKSKEESVQTKSIHFPSMSKGEKNIRCVFP